MTTTDTETEELTVQQLNQEMAADRERWPGGIDRHDSVACNSIYLMDGAGPITIQPDGRVTVPAGSLKRRCPEDWQEVCQVMLPHLLFAASSSRWRGTGTIAGVAHQLAEKVADHLRLWSLHFDEMISIPEPMTFEGVTHRAIA